MGDEMVGDHERERDRLRRERDEANRLLREWDRIEGGDPLSYSLRDRTRAHLARSPEEPAHVSSPLTFARLQQEQRPWVQHNFAGREPFYPLLGAMEELGELSHAHLKALQGIRTNEDHEADKRDAVADIVIFLADYCTANKIDFQDAVEETWAKVKQRDWKADPEGGTNAKPPPEEPAEPRRPAGESNSPGMVTTENTVEPCPDCAEPEEETCPSCRHAARAALREAADWCRKKAEWQRALTPPTDCGLNKFREGQVKAFAETEQRLRAAAGGERDAG